MILAAFIELIAKIKQKNNGTFKLVDAQDVECDEGKGLDEVLNEKLDKNLGAENTNKVLVTDAEGNVVTQDKEDFEGGGTENYNDLENKPTINDIELSGNKTSKDLKMYTQEEVNYLLDDKMDKPYYDISITDDVTIENTLAGNFKMDSIEGSIYQAEESGIVPTPERPIPIRSKKITVDGEIVELRSLKESKNLFDKNIMAFTSGTLNSDGTVGINASYAVSGFVPVKPSTQYTIKVIDGFRGSTKVYYDINKQVILNEGDITFTTPSNCYFVRWQTATTDTRVLTEDDIQKINDEMMMVKGNSLPSSYVPPTVRDYKIVDHKTKTSKIVRNVKNIDLSSIRYQYLTGIDDKPYRVANYVYTLTSIQGSYKYIYANSEKVYSYNGFQSRMENGLCVSEHGIMRVVNGVTNKDELKTYVDNNRVDILYALATPTEESIPYLEDDTSEVGYSWQDTTSPSPDIESKIYEVDEINIKLVGKNIFNPNSTDTVSTGIYSAIIVNPLNAQITVSITDNDTSVDITGIYLGVSGNTEYFDDLTWMITSNAIVRTKTINSKCITYYPKTEATLQKLLQRFNIQVEEGSAVTDYEPYQETSIQHTLSKPLRATKDGSVRDVIDIINMQTIYKLKKDIFDGSQLFRSSDLGYTDTTRFNIKIDDFEIGSNKEHFIWCDKLKNKNGDIPNEEYIRLVSGTFGRFLWLYIIKNRLNDISATSFREWLKQNPLTTIYQLETPITEPLEDELVKKLKTLKTFSPVTHVFITGIAKPKLNARYPKDIASAQAQLEQKVITLQEAVIKNA